VCGPTVYDEPHIGHARSAYIFDVIRRYLVYKGYKVKFVRNVTDVDDKIIDRARKEYPDIDLISAVKKISCAYLDIYHEAMKSLGILEPDIEPKASEYIDKMILFIENLINRGMAYPSDGDVYFDIKKAKDYGKLSHQSIDKMEVGARVLPGENKRDPLDFALWKAAKEAEPAWESPWGEGRPGWHIECSAMSSDILGDEFDIHGGGIDLIFPHHENEIAQSEGAGKGFAKYWMHHGLLTINGQKMAKSLGNFITIQDVLKKYPADVLKIFYLQAHYSSPIDFSWEKMEEAKRALERIIILMITIKEKLVDYRLPGASNELKETQEIKNKFISAMDDDFNTPQGLATIFELVNIMHKNIDNLGFISNAKGLLLELANIFGLELREFISSSSAFTDIESLIAKRNEARKIGNFQEADKIRRELEDKGIILEDTKDGTIWRRKL